jgi:archaellum component FlaC
MSKEKGELPITTDMIDRSFEEREGGPTSIDVTANRNSIEEVSHAEPQEVLEQNRPLAHSHEEPSIHRRKQRKRITSYLSHISKQLEKHGNQINKMTLVIQSLQKQKQTKSAAGAGIDQIQFRSIKQIKSQISQLQKQVSRIQNDIGRIRTASMTRTRAKTKFRKQAPSTIAAVKYRSKRSKLLKSTKVKKRRK